MSKPQHGWGITFAAVPDKVMPWTVRPTRGAAIGAALDWAWLPDKSTSREDKWKYLRRRGCRAVKVTIAIQES